jgi:hypothetical protein
MLCGGIGTAAYHLKTELVAGKMGKLRRVFRISLRPTQCNAIDEEIYSPNLFLF